ncbi:MAG: bifunctional adenosylcobinamide kinase/adenosylcobinamide-phosphate guanylyltransferase [Desulfobacca sp.]|uniref:bifunctional adenosylcobinamide kinase/adenosylcobinamide-phosphate guanylyltransferase n=1 Tax=Desulfobacca sp. TaxID=2067990 RepID=UPI00404B7E04
MIGATPTWRLALMLGGAKSGKSRLAQRLAEEQPKPRLYVATGEAKDPEMQVRIRRHQEDRGPSWETWEEPLALGEALAQAEGHFGVILVDCLTLWLSNLLAQGEAELARARQKLLAVLPTLTTPVILVSNEVGGGIVPANPLARRFRDEAGLLHQELAQLADLVALVVCGLPIYLKGVERG